MTATLFVLIAAGLVLIALGIVILPLMREKPVLGIGAEAADARFVVLGHGLDEIDADFASGALDRAGYDEARRELEQQALDAHAAAGQPAPVRRTSWRAALTLGVTLPLAAGLLYAMQGNPAALWPSAGAQLAAANSPHGASTNMAAMADRFAQQLEQNSSKLADWLLLARSYHALGRPQEAVAAYRKAVALSPDNPDLLIEYANTLALAHGRDLSGAPWQLIRRALELAPENPNVLALAGAAAAQDGRIEDAVRYWTDLKRLLPADAPNRGKIDEYIARVQGQNQQAPQNVAIQGTVKLSGALAAAVSPGDTLFIYAKAADGPPMPLAIQRSSASGWPVSFTLDDSSAMMPDLRLSQYPRVNITARISRTGNARPQPGDLQGRIDGIALGSQGVRIVIDRRIGG